MFEYPWWKKQEEDKDREWERNRPRIQPFVPGQPGMPLEAPHKDASAEQGPRGIATFDVSPAPPEPERGVRPAAEISIKDLPPIVDEDGIPVDENQEKK